MLRAHRLVSAQVAGGDFLQDFEIGLSGRGAAAWDPRAPGAGPGALPHPRRISGAWRILALVRLGRECPELSCEVVFAPEEWQAAWIVARRERPPSTPPTLGQMTRIVAGFGGFLGRKGDGHPGPKALWAGMQKLMDDVDSIQSLREAFDLDLTYG